MGLEVVDGRAVRGKRLVSYLGSATKVLEKLLEQGQQPDRSASSLFEL
jgi:hypothetical protein